MFDRGTSSSSPFHPSRVWRQALALGQIGRDHRTLVTLAEYNERRVSRVEPAGHRPCGSAIGEDDVTEDEVRVALTQLDPLWGEVFPAEQARIVQLLIERVDVRMHGVEVRLRPNRGSQGSCARWRQPEGGGVTRATVSADGE